MTKARIMATRPRAGLPARATLATARAPGMMVIALRADSHAEAG
ncbi:hypothetical protein [Nonomuraea recticatena]